MLRLTITAAIVTVGLVFGAPRAKDAPKKDSRIVGSWRLLTLNGQDTVQAIYTFSADGTLRVRGRIGMAEAGAQFRYSTDEKTDPPRINGSSWAG